MRALANLLAEARRAAEPDEDRVILDDLLDGLLFALPARLTPQHDLIKATARRDVPKWFGNDPNQR